VGCDVPQYRSNRTKRLRERLVKHIAEAGPKSSRELLDYFNKVNKNGTTMHSLTNVLSKDPRFVVVDTIRVSQHMSGRYDMFVWGLAGEEEE